MSQHETIIIDSDEDTAPLAPAVVATSGGVIKPTGAVPLVPEAAASQESGPAAVPVLAAAVPVPTATVPVPVASVPVPAANVQSGRRRRPGRPSISRANLEPQPVGIAAMDVGGDEFSIRDLIDLMWAAEDENDWSDDSWTDKTWS